MTNEEKRLLSYYTMRNRIGAKALKNDSKSMYYHCLYLGIKDDHGKNIPESLLLE